MTDALYQPSVVGEGLDNRSKRSSSSLPSQLRFDHLFSQQKALTMYYIHVVGSYDNTFVGPFANIDSAAAYLSTIDRDRFSAYIMTHRQFKENVREHGIAHIQAVLP